MGNKRLINRNFYMGMGLGIFVGLILAAFGAYYIVLKPAANGFTGDTVNRMFESHRDPPALPSETSSPTDPAADYQWKCKTLDGADFDMAQLKGKTVFLDFWATSNQACVLEMASIDRLCFKTKNKVTFLCVTGEDKNTVQPFLDKTRLSLPVYLYQEKPPAVFDMDPLPAQFILSPEGKIVFKHNGAANWDDAKCVDFLNRVAQGTGGKP